MPASARQPALEQTRFEHTPFEHTPFEHTTARAIPAFDAQNSGMSLYLIYDSRAVFQPQGLERPSGGIDRPHGAVRVNCNRDFGIATKGDFQNLLGLAEEKAHADPYRPGAGNLRMRAIELPK